jgi:Ca-activated chloride channel homolog
MTATKRTGRLAALGFAILAGGAAGLFADGFIIPRPKPGETIPALSVKSHHVTVEITNQVAKTSIDQIFVNNYGRDIEGTYIFPIPDNASVSDFAMWMGNVRVQGEILDGAQARRIYEDIVRRMRDPGLLEYMGRNMFRARVYPIPANGEKRIQISYTEILEARKGLVRYLYPLNTEKFSRDPLGEVSLSARITSPVPILNVYSPSHPISVRREDGRRVTFGYEEKNVKPDTDFVVYYSLSQDEVGLSLINWEGPEDNYFMLMAAPKYASERERVIDKNVVLVLDSSGSMSGTKIRQTKAAARFIIDHLNDSDRFSIIDFDDGVTLFSDGLVAADRAARERALRFVDGIEDSGGTNINEALIKALALSGGGDRPSYILFLTDGLPTVGVVRTDEILGNISRSESKSSRIIVFGVGNDVNTALLDRISSDHRGTSVYVGENDNLETAVSGYYEKISSPLLSDLAVEFDGLEVSGLYPKVLPDLFKGSQLVLLGKYKGRGPANVVLKGKVGRVEKRFVLEEQALASDNSMSFLGRLWATRRVGYLLEEIRLRGQNQELVDEIRRLGLRFGIVTPYTSFLVTEKEGMAMEAAAPAARDAMKAQQVSGSGAVMAAKVSQKLKGGDQASLAVSEQIRYKDDKTFYLKDGFWVDSVFREGDPVKEIKFNSDEFFRLLSGKPGLAKYLSVGRRALVAFEGINYRIVE